MPAERPRPTVIAHRGSSGARPEHSRAAYELAIAAGADALEPDVVVSRDGVLVVRHEHEISGTTDVADRPEFAGRRRAGDIDGEPADGWFAEDFTWAELSTLRCRERLPELRPESAAFDGAEPVLRLADVLAIADAADREVGVVVELKHAAHATALGHDLPALLAETLRAAGWATGRPLVVESFEASALAPVRAAGIEATLVALYEAGTPARDHVLELGGDARTPEQLLAGDGLACVAAGGIDGVSVNLRFLFADGPDGAAAFVGRAHAAGLLVYVWTLRAENAFLPAAHRTGEPGELGDWAGWFRAVIATGVDGVFADQPELALAARG